jgi:hypothetical protein
MVLYLNDLPPARIVIDDGAEGVDEERALEIHILRRGLVDAARGDDRLAVPDLGPVAVEVLQRVGLAEHVLDIHPLGVRPPGLVDPFVADVIGGNAVAEPFVCALVDDDEVELRADADACPVPLQVAIGETVPVRDGALMLHAGVVERDLACPSSFEDLREHACIVEPLERPSYRAWQPGSRNAPMRVE